ncbi:Stk1 family PASTA domain-containing Ser/Thr kinase [Nocardioides sp. YIM 152315]|uniref:Stk1 family PASTA domain-containing Ser/Thr kinase n=1 Tax=Nocardioides sp. YIM 152315 TaxID=3031760 RepID=UPI0023DA53E1|nr:Stk1 family PASTA domain-containing Ser/Thr kinase [Nocardioides sp. YIM 152315]MDF1603049.1 Stk1 family PASTA domain-containing Ser/Thr kinase [Nocardioides sp. YIM 152315]
MQPDRHDDRHARAGGAGAAADPMTGRVLEGRYRIGARIARGGMASVYEATDIRLDRTVAVKVMHPGLGDDNEFAERFVREARAAARLSHPNVVAVYDQGDDHGTVFLAMELVPGHTLRDVIRKESPMPPAKALALLEPVLSALATAHRAGLIHRDIKPENVLIATLPNSGASRVKVADFGLAKAVSADTQHTATGGVLIGTVSYLAPELVVNGRADARADVYAAGVVLYEMLTGTKPHEGETPIQVAYQHVHEDVPPPSGVVPGIPTYVDALVARATARDRELRPADAAVLLHQVHRVSHALAEGVADDPDLTADLTPLRMRLEAAEAPSTEDTAPDPFDGRVLATLGPPAPAADTDLTAPLRTLDPPPTPTPPRPPARPVDGPPPGRRRSRKGLVLLVAALLLVVGGGAAAWWFIDGRYTSTPGVLGMTRAAAEAELASAGLDAELGDEAYSETVAAGRVVATDPEPGDRVRDGGTVSVTISLGKERYDVPKLKGMTEDAAQDALTGTHLGFGKTTEKWSDTVPAGEVIASDPKAGTTLRPDSPVDLVVSKGPKPVDLKDWVGKSADKALEWFDKRGLSGKVASEEYSDDVAEGDVISMDPPGGTTLHRGDEVSIVVSKGPELIEVPSVRGNGVDAARETLEGLGFHVEVEDADGSLGLGFVWSQSPEAGDMVPPGTTITLSLI